MTTRTVPPLRIDEPLLTYQAILAAIQEQNRVQWAEWLKIIANEQRRQTSALEDMRWMMLFITVVVGVNGALSILGGLMASGLVR